MPTFSIIVLVVIGLAVVAVIAIAALRAAKKPAGTPALRAAEKPAAIDVGPEIRAMSPNMGVQWTEIYERLNPDDDPQVTQMLQEFRLSGYQLNAHLGLNVIAASYDAISERRGQAADSVITIQEVLGEAMRQHRKVAGR